MHLKRMWILLHVDEMFHVYLSILCDLMFHWTPTFPYWLSVWIFHPLIWIWCYSPLITLLLSVSLFRSVKICFLYFSASMFSCCITPLSWYKVYFCHCSSVFVLKYILSVMREAPPTFFWLLFAWSIIFHSFTLSLCLSLELKWVSCRHTCTWVLFFNPSSHSAFRLLNSIHLH